MTTTKKETANINLPWNLETMGAMLAQPCYGDAEARANLRENPKAVVAAMAQSMDEAIKKQNSVPQLAKMGETVSNMDVVVHENTADTWNIVLPSEQTLEEEGQNPWMQQGPLKDDVLEEVSAGEIVLVSTTALVGGSSALFAKLGLLAAAAIGTSAVVVIAGSAAAIAVGAAVAAKQHG